MPKAKRKPRLSRENLFKEAGEALSTVIQSSKSISLVPYLGEPSSLNYYSTAGFQVYDNPNHPAFKAALRSWMLSSLGNTVTLPNQGYLAPQNSLGSVPRGDRYM